MINRDSAISTVPLSFTDALHLLNEVQKSGLEELNKLYVLLSLVFNKILGHFINDHSSLIFGN